jgi:2-dehydropantoate 2-reductase
MRFLIAGAGAIGGYIGAKLARAGEDVTLFARGPHLQAMCASGLRVISPDDDFEVRPRIIGDLREAGPAEVIFLGVKAHGLTQLAPQITPLIGEHTSVVSTQNGVPWWYFQFEKSGQFENGGRVGKSEFANLHLERVDPGGVIARSIDCRHVIGSIAYFSTDIVEPGVIRHNEGNRISIGEPDGSRSERARAIAERLVKAGLRAPLTARIRHEIWVKILGNVAFNPISAMTRATLEQIVRDPETCSLVRNIMTEAEAVATKLGMELPVSIEQRIAGAEKVGAHKTSMLQDLEAGRPMEIEAIVGAVVELGDRLGVAMPHTRSVYACTKLLDILSRGGNSK